MEIETALAPDLIMVLLLDTLSRAITAYAVALSSTTPTIDRVAYAA